MKKFERYEAENRAIYPEENELESQDEFSSVIEIYYIDGETSEEECTRCAAPIWDSFRYCPQCGELQEEDDK